MSSYLFYGVSVMGPGEGVYGMRIADKGSVYSDGMMAKRESGRGIWVEG